MLRLLRTFTTFTKTGVRHEWKRIMSRTGVVAILALAVVGCAQPTDRPVRAASSPRASAEASIPPTPTLPPQTPYDRIIARAEAKPHVPTPTAVPRRVRGQALGIQRHAVNDVGVEWRSVSSTCYSLTSNNAAGRSPRQGDVAMNGVPMGSRWLVKETGAIYVVADRIGHSSQFDIWNPSTTWCKNYGRRQIHVRRIEG